MYLGLDIGTSAVKALIMDDAGAVVAEAGAALTVSRPKPLWSEQDPADWWRATNSAVRALDPKVRAAVRAVGLAGQMHGATLLDQADQVLRPAILWNDGRSGAECVALEAAEPSSRTITGNLAMPGFTAPKLLWVRQHEPQIFGEVTKVLLPKDYVRLRMTGDHATDLSDAAGTLWLDVARRRWSGAMLAATGLSTDAMPELFEGSQATGKLRADIAHDWGMDQVPVAAGGGDNAAGAVGMGVIAPGQAFLSLGTSGVLFVANGGFSPNPDQAVHAFCHALPGRWHQMSVILSAASCLDWVAGVAGFADVPTALAAANQADSHGDEVFLPYLAGERTPHNDPHAKGVFFGLTHRTNGAALVRSVLEGVAFAFADGQDALLETGAEIGDISVIGGGARSRQWGTILATVLGCSLTYRRGGEAGPAFGAARLARLAHTSDDPEHVCTAPPISHIVDPDPDFSDALTARQATYRALYGHLSTTFRSVSGSRL